MDEAELIAWRKLLGDNVESLLVKGKDYIVSFGSEGLECNCIDFKSEQLIYFKKPKGGLIWATRGCIHIENILKRNGLITDRDFSNLKKRGYT